MSDLNAPSGPDDGLVREAFLDLHRETVALVRPPGVDAASARAQQRHRRRVVAAAFAAVLLAAIPVGIYAAGPRPLHATPFPPATPDRTSLPAPTLPPGTTAATQGAGELANATLSIPWVDCSGVSDPVTYRDGVHQANPRSGQPDWPMTIERVADGDVNHDGRPDVVALASCWLGSAFYQVVAFTRQPNGAYGTLGSVVQMYADTSGVDNDVRDIGAFGITSDGRVVVTVFADRTCCAIPANMTISQVRTYGWQGSAFAQVGGPHTFAGDAKASALSATAPAIRLDPMGLVGTQSGTARITVTNAGPQPAGSVRAHVWIYSMTAAGGADWAQCPGGVCDLGTLTPGQSVTLDLPFTTSDDVTSDRRLGQVIVTAGEQVYATVELDAG